MNRHSDSKELIAITEGDFYRVSDPGGGFYSLAKVLAEDAYGRKQRRIGHVTDSDGDMIGLYIYDDKPFANAKIRPRIFAEVRAHLEANGCTLAAEVAYPLKGKDAGHAIAVVYRCKDTEASAVRARRILYSMIHALPEQ